MRLYREMLAYSDLPKTITSGIFQYCMDEVRRRFAIYWTHEAMETRDKAEASNWRQYMAQCIDSPAFLDSDNVALMVDQIGAGVAEGKLSYEMSIDSPSVVAIAQTIHNSDIAEEVLKSHRSYDPQRSPHLPFYRLPDSDLTDGDGGAA